mgnify:CR=1 FL=1
MGGGGSLMGMVSLRGTPADYAEWVEKEFNVNNIYDEMLEFDYIEGSLGCRFEIQDNPESKSDEYMNEFLISHDLNEIQLKYGG